MKPDWTTEGDLASTQISKWTCTAEWKSGQGGAIEELRSKGQPGRQPGWEAACRASAFCFPSCRAGKEVNQPGKGSGQRGGSAIKSTGCSSKGHRFSTQHPQGGSTICNCSSRRNNALFWLLWVPGAHVVHRHTSRTNTYTQ